MPRNYRKNQATKTTQYTSSTQSAQPKSNAFDRGYSAGYKKGLNERRSDIQLKKQLDAEYDEGYDEGYDDGFSVGEIAGNQKGYDKGYNDASDKEYNKGYDDGYDVGYSKGKKKVSKTTTKQYNLFKKRVAQTLKHMLKSYNDEQLRSVLTDFAIDMTSSDREFFDLSCESNAECKCNNEHNEQSDLNFNNFLTTMKNILFEQSNSTEKTDSIGSTESDADDDRPRCIGCGVYLTEDDLNDDDVTEYEAEAEAESECDCDECQKLHSIECVGCGILIDDDESKCNCSECNCSESDRSEESNYDRPKCISCGVYLDEDDLTNVEDDYTDDFDEETNDYETNKVTKQNDVTTNADYDYSSSCASSICSSHMDSEMEVDNVTNQTTDKNTEASEILTKIEELSKRFSLNGEKHEQLAEIIDNMLKKNMDIKVKFNTV